MDESLKCIVREHVRFIIKNISASHVKAIIYCIEKIKNKNGKIHFNHEVLYNECMISNFVRAYSKAPDFYDNAIEKRLKLIDEYVNEAKTKGVSVLEKYTTKEWYNVIISTNDKCGKYIDRAEKSIKIQKNVICSKCGGSGYLPEGQPAFFSKFLIKVSLKY